MGTINNFLLAKCINTEDNIVLKASNIEELSDINIIETLANYLPQHYNNSNKVVTFSQLSFSPLCLVTVGTIEFIFKFIDITKLN